MTLADVGPSQELLSQLGYPLDAKELRRRYAAVAGDGGHALFVAEQHRRIVALCHVYARPALDKPPEAVVQALVVDHAIRGSGVGRAMMTTVEAWASQRGFKSVALASSIARTEAHAFYQAIGYVPFAASQLFRKVIAPENVADRPDWPPDR